MTRNRNFCLVFIFLFLFLFTAVFVLPGAGAEPQKRLQLELLQGYTSINPADLNLKITALQNRFEQAFSSYYTYLSSIQYVISFDQTREGEFRSLKRAFPSGIRLKYYLGKLLAVSLGFKYFSKAEVSEVGEKFTIIENSGRESLDSYDFSPFELNVSGYIPQLGIHAGWDLSDFLRMEAFVSGGPIFTSFGFSYTYHTDAFYADSGIAQNNEYYLEMDGTGKAFALESGAQMSLDLGRHVSLLFEGGYAYQKLHCLSGSGKEAYRGLEETWEGNWMIKEYVIYRPWGDITRTWPSNYWKGEEHLNIRDFVLDLSGWQVRLGLAYRF
jgi:hypothetical protein